MQLKIGPGKGGFNQRVRVQIEPRQRKRQKIESKTP